MYKSIIRMVLIVFLLSILGSQVFAQANLLSGGDFEGATLDAAFFNGVDTLAAVAPEATITSDTSVTGANSLKITGIFPDETKLRQAIAVEAGKVYRFSGWAKLEGQTAGLDGKGQIEVHWGPRSPITRANRTTKPFKFGPVPVDAPWTYFVFEQRVPEGAAVCEFGIYSNTDGVVYFDDCRVVEKQTILCDGFEDVSLSANWLDLSNGATGAGKAEITTDEAKLGAQSLKVTGTGFPDDATTLRWNLDNIDTTATYTMSGWLMLAGQDPTFDGKAQIETHWGTAVDATGRIKDFRKTKPKKLKLVSDSSWSYFSMDITPDIRSDQHPELPAATLAQFGIYLESDGIGYFDNVILTTDIVGGTAVQAVSQVVPVGYTLDQNYPNPFNPTTRICYALPNAAQVKLSIFNLSGQMIKALKSEHQSAGSYNIIWNGRNEAGEFVSTGTYLYRLEAIGADSQSHVQTRKLIFIK